MLAVAAGGLFFLDLVFLAGAFFVVTFAVDFSFVAVAAGTAAAAAWRLLRRVAGILTMVEVLCSGCSDIFG